MSGARALYAIARADFLERVRRSSFLAILALAAWLGWLVVRGQVALRVGRYTGVLNGAWAGALVSVTLSCIVSLAGFWIVKGSVARDRTTRVGEILAATPLRAHVYTLGKLLSNFSVLSAIVLVLALAAPLLVLLNGKSLQLGAMLAPFFLIALPALAVVAALAVLFETIRPLSGSAGNVLWFFLWSALLAVPLAAGWPHADLSGLSVLYQSTGSVAKATFADSTDGFSLTIAGQELAQGSFVWNGVDWTPGLVASRCAWFGVAALIALLAALPFDRFDERRVRRGKDLEERMPDALRSYAAPRVVKDVHLTPLAATGSHGTFLAMVRGELRLMLKGLSLWWWVVALGLLIAGFAAPRDIARAHILPFAWIWPVAVWSKMGAREALAGTEELVFTAPRPLLVQLPALYLAGVSVALLAAGGVGLKCLLTGSIGAFAGWLAGALFIPALALALGASSRTSKLFEALYTVLWYVGPLQPTPALDFMGASDAGLAVGMPLRTLFAVALLLGVAILARRVRVRS